jgi:hypothetical protein
MKTSNLVGLVAAPLMVFAMSLPAWAADAAAATTCTDGTTSTATGRGACSGHGGVQKPAKSKAAAGSTAATPAAAPAATPAPAAPPTKSPTASKSAPTASAGNTDPTGATAKCKDGTYSKSQHHSGTCSSHGGVAEWLTAK